MKDHVSWYEMRDPNLSVDDAVQNSRFGDDEVVYSYRSAEV